MERWGTIPTKPKQKVDCTSRPNPVINGSGKESNVRGSSNDPIELSSTDSSVEDSIVRYIPFKKGSAKKPSTISHYYGKNGTAKNSVIDISKIPTDGQEKLLKDCASCGKKPTVNFNFATQEEEKVVNLTPDEFTQMSFNMMSQFKSQFQLGQDSVGSTSVPNGLLTQKDSINDEFYLPPSYSPSSSDSDSSSESVHRMTSVGIKKKKGPSLLQLWLARNNIDSCSSASGNSFVEELI